MRKRKEKVVRREYSLEKREKKWLSSITERNFNFLVSFVAFNLFAFLSLSFISRIIITTIIIIS